MDAIRDNAARAADRDGTIVHVVEIQGLTRAGLRARIDDALAAMGLTAAAGALVRTYSGGMIRRLEIAQATLHRPAVLFLDEPTVGLDPTARHAVWQLLSELRARSDTTILLSTHDVQEAELCSWLAIMHRGHLVVTGTPAGLKAQIGATATLDDVFVRHTGGSVEAGGSYIDVARTRRTATRLG